MQQLPVPDEEGIETFRNVDQCMKRGARALP